MAFFFLANDDGEDVSTLPDNFSDMMPVSANVSGRESPSVSGPPSVNGHDTPQSENVRDQSRTFVTFHLEKKFWK